MHPHQSLPSTPLTANFGPASVDGVIEKFFSERGPASSPHHGRAKAPAEIEGWLGAPLDLSRAAAAAASPVDYVLAPIFPAGRASLVTGLGASSKSTMLKTLAVATATGRGALGMNVNQPGKAILLLAEDTAEDALRSLAAIGNAMGLNGAEQALLQQRLVVFAVAGQDCVLIEPDGSGGPSVRLSQLLDFAKRLGDVRLIGLDPAIALSRGRELDELAQRDLANAAERLAVGTGAAVIVISHAAKSSQFQSEVMSHMSRGSGAITDAFRLEVGMRVMTAKEAQALQVPPGERHRFVKMQVTKANCLPPELMKPVWLQRVQGGALALAHITPSASAGQARQINALEPFLDTDPQTGEVIVLPLSKSQWKAQAAEMGLLTGSTPSARDMSASRLLAGLREMDWIRESEGTLQVTDKGLNAARVMDGQN